MKLPLTCMRNVMNKCVRDARIKVTQNVACDDRSDCPPDALSGNGGISSRTVIFPFSE